MIAILLNNPSERLVSALRLSSFKDFKIYVKEHGNAIPGDEDSLNYTIGGLDDVKEEFVMYICPQAEPSKDMLGRVNRTVTEHPEFNVYHLNLEGGPKFPLKAKADRLFTDVFIKGMAAPLPSFIFRTSVLKEKIVHRVDDTIDPLASAIACIDSGEYRTVRFATLRFNARALTPQQAEEKAWRRIEFLRWTENYWGDEDYPLTVARSFSLFAKEIVALYPGRSKDELKEIMDGFSTVKGPVRKLMASSALKKAIKEKEAGSEPLGQPVED